MISVSLLSQQYIKSIYAFNDTDCHYGLKLLFVLNDGYLYFNSTKFIYLTDYTLLGPQNWNNFRHDLPRPVAITSIKEDELTSYFVTLSNQVIVYVKEAIKGDTFWYQDFEIVNMGDTRYKKIIEHMNEDWIETLEEIDTMP